MLIAAARILSLAVISGIRGNGRPVFPRPGNARGSKEPPGPSAVLPLPDSDILTERWQSPLLIQQPGPDRAVEGANLRQNDLTLLAHLLGLEHHITDLAVSLVVLRGDIDLAAGKHVIEAAEHAGKIVLHL